MTLQPSVSIPEYADDRFVDPDDQMVESPTGGLNSPMVGRFDLLDGSAIARIAAVLDYGNRKYGPENWRLDPPELHLNHALQHIFNYLEQVRKQGSAPTPSPDGKYDELGHAATRVMFALAVEFQSEAERDEIRARELIRRG